MKNLYTVSITAIFILLVQFTGYSATIQKEIELKHSLFDVAYTPEGITFNPAVEKMGWKWKLRSISGISTENGSVQPVAKGKDVFYERGFITEQYLFRSFSIEQQFIIRSAESLTGDLVIEGVVQSEGLFKRVDGGWCWTKNEGNVFVGDVFVYDANGKPLQASMEVTSTSTRIIVDYFALKNASYPVTIDPQIGTDDFVLNNDFLRAYQPKLIFNTTDNAFFSSWTKYAGSGLARNEDIYGGSFTRALIKANPKTVDQPGANLGIRVSTDAPSGSSLNSSATNPDVAYCGSNYLTVWEDYYQLSGNKRLINSRISSIATTTTDVATLFNDATFSETYSSPRYPAVAGNNTKFLVISSVFNKTSSSYNVLGKFVQPTGTAEATTDYFSFFSSSTIFTDVDIDARPSGNFAIAASTLNAIYYGRADNAGNISEIGSKTGLGKVGSVAISAKDNSNFLVVWSELTGSGSTAKYVIKGSINGGTAFQIDDSNQNGSGKPSAAYNPDSDSWLVAWHCSPSTATSGTMIWARELLPNGTLNNAFPVSKQTRTSVTPTVAYDSQNHEFWIAWSGGGSKDQLLAQRWTNSMSDCIISLKRDTIHENNYKGSPFNPNTDKYITAFKALNSSGDSIYPLDFVIYPNGSSDDGTKFQTSYLQSSNTQTSTISTPDDYYKSKNKLFYVDDNYINYELKDSYSFSVYAQSEITGVAGRSSTQTQTVKVVDMNEQFSATISPTVSFLEDQVAPKIPFTYNSGDEGYERNPIGLTVTATPAMFVSAPTMSSSPSIPDDGHGNTIPRTQLTTTENLSFSLKPNVSGTQTLTFTLTDQKYGVWSATQKENTKSYSVAVTVIAVNDAPTFTQGDNVIVNEDCGTQTITAWAGNISTGAPDESGQTLTFTVTNSDNTLFSDQPQISSSGVLTFTPAANQFGTATITVYLKDDGGIANGGVDQSGTVTFTITVNPVNDNPTFAKGSDQTILEDAGTQTITSWANDISAGPSNESSQLLAFTVTNDNNTLFEVQPAIDVLTGTLTYKPNPDISGTTTVIVTLSDDGGTANGGTDSSTQTFVITISPVNDAPVFTKGADQTILEDSGAQMVTAWATGIGPGNSYESSQTLQFFVSNDNNVLFAVQPSISSTGTLTFTPASNAYGTATVSVRLEDNGGTDKGGVNTTASETFTITVAPVNDAPTFSLGIPLITYEDSGAKTFSGWVSGINAGSANESGQTLSITITTDKPELFSVQPTVNVSTGDLTFTPAPDAFGIASLTVTLSDDGGTLSGGVDSYTQSSYIEIISVNDSPSFTAGDDQLISLGAGIQTVPNWATNISAGPANESDQTLTFILANTNNLLFDMLPEINPAGTLTYLPALGSYGTATVTVRLKDDGGTANGGTDSATQTFTITILPLNHAPSFTAGTNITVGEDSGTQTVTWATNISAGPSYESGQSLTFTVTNSDNTLFSDQPQISSSGVLTFTPAANQFGTATITVYLKDDGGIANGGVDQSGTVTFTITVNPVNDNPTFAKGSDQTILEDAGTQTITSWANDISAGPSNESSQLLAFTVTNDNNTLFEVQPAIDALTGTLTYKPNPDISGTTTVTVTLSDDGGTANGGTDSSTQTFVITISPVNDAPVFTKGADQTVLEDSGTQTVTAWATGISAGNSYESEQTLQFFVSNNNNALFAEQPSITETGILTYTPAENEYGSATVTIRLEDNGGMANGGVNTTASETFTITVAPVNDAPSFTAGANQVVNEDCGTQTVTAWATNISKGNIEEDLQSIHFVLSNSNNSLFSGQPSIDELGNLYFTPGANAFGTATITVWLTDDGGVANGGVDTSSSTVFSITVNPFNDKPLAVNSLIQTLENTDYIFQITDFGFSDSADPTDLIMSATIMARPDKGTLLFGGTEVNTFPFTFNVSQVSSLVFRPASYQYGSPYTVLNFKVSDNNSANAANGIQWSDNLATLSIEVIRTNHPPTTENQYAYIEVDSEYSFELQNFGFSDPDLGNKLGGVKIESLPVKGQLLLNGSPILQGTIVSAHELGGLVYKPNPGERGEQYASFLFRVQDFNELYPADEKLLSLNAYIFFITVRAINHVPESVDKIVHISKDRDYDFSSEDFLLVDPVDKSDVLSEIKIELEKTESNFKLDGKIVKNGSVVPVDSIGFLKFEANGYTGDSFGFRFRVTDNNSVGALNGKLQSASAYSFTIILDKINSAPTLVKPFADIDAVEFEDFASQIDWSNFVDPDGDQLTYQVNIASGNWIHKSDAGELSGFPLPDSESQATVTVRATDPQGLWVEDSFLVNVTRKNRPLLYGQVTGAKALPSNLLVELYKYDASKPEVLTHTNTSVSNYYYFEGVATGTYLIKAVNNQTDSYPDLVSTYYTSTLDWTKATQITIASGEEYQANVEMYFNQATDGAGSIAGYVKASDKNSPAQGQNPENWDEVTPYAYADIILKETGQSGLILYTQSAANGAYVFDNLPWGEYEVTVAVPGFLSTQTYLLKVNQEKSTYENVNFLIYLGNGVITNNDLLAFSQNVTLYPNPTTGLINLVSQNFSESLFIKVIDMNGQIVLKKQFSPEVSNQLNIGNLLTGTYYIEVKSGNFVKTIPVILMKMK